MVHANSNTKFTIRWKHEQVLILTTKSHASDYIVYNIYVRT